MEFEEYIDVCWILSLNARVWQSREKDKNRDKTIKTLRSGENTFVFTFHFCLWS